MKCSLHNSLLGSTAAHDLYGPGGWSKPVGGTDRVWLCCAEPSRSHRLGVCCLGPARHRSGDDAIELFQSNAVIDTFGDISVDGTGQP